MNINLISKLRILYTVLWFLHLRCVAFLVLDSYKKLFIYNHIYLYILIYIFKYSAIRATNSLGFIECQTLYQAFYSSVFVERSEAYINFIK